MKEMGQEKSGQQYLLLAIVTLFWFAQYVYIPFQTPYLTGIQVSASMIGSIIGAYGVTQMLVRFPVGIMADRKGKHKGFIFLGAFLAACASAIRIGVPTGGGFFAANLLSGCGSSMWISYMVMYTGMFSAEEQQKATSRMILFNNLGIFLAFGSGTLCYDHFGMNFLCLLSMAAGAAGAILALFLKEKTPVHSPNTSVGQLVRVCKNRRLLLFAGLALVQQGIQMSTTMSFTTQILEDLGAGSQLIGFSSVFYMLSSVFFAWLAARPFCTKNGPRLWVPIVFLAIALYCVVVGEVGNIWVILLFQILPGMSSGILFSYLTSEAMQEIPVRQKSTAMGFFQAVYAIGMTGLPLFTGQITDRLSVMAAYRGLALIAVAAMIVSLAFYRSEE
ncbi:MAG: MFS transporter [Massiliimalia sp.]|jgi:predicted MFS family arabinose efflux permease